MNLVLSHACTSDQHHARDRRPGLLQYLVLTALLPSFLLFGCGWFRSPDPPRVPLHERLKVCILPLGIDIKIRKLSSIQTVEEVSPTDEPARVAAAVTQIRARARQFFYDRLAGSQQFEVVPLEQTDQALARLGLGASHELSREQIRKLQQELGVDLVLSGSILDYGKIRWQWAAAGMLSDMTWESIALGLATSWNPIAILASIGFELLTSPPLWFGGAYLFGWAFRPVRLEASAIDPVLGDTVWGDTEFVVYLGKALQEVPEEERKKKEVQLELNLRRATEGLGDSLIQAQITKAALWEHRLPAGPEMTPMSR
jgi:hypothetical protein